MDPDPAKVVLDIGLAKGYNLVDFASYWSPISNTSFLSISRINTKVWSSALSYASPSAVRGLSDYCGECKRCLNRRRKRPLHTGNDGILPDGFLNSTKEPTFFGFSSNEKSIRVVAKANTRLKAKVGKELKLHLHHRSTSSKQPQGGLTSDCKWHHDNCNTLPGTGQLTVKKEASIDFIMETIISHENIRSRSPLQLAHQNGETGMRNHFAGQKDTLVDVLFIDQSFGVYNILVGAEKSFAEKRIRIVNFKWNKKEPRSLSDHLLVMERFDYRCGVQSSNSLFPVSSACAEYTSNGVPRLSITCVLTGRNDPWEDAFNLELLGLREAKAINSRWNSHYPFGIVEYDN
jgi:hypothetical protein